MALTSGVSVIKLLLVVNVNKLERFTLASLFSLVQYLRATQEPTPVDHLQILHTFLPVDIRPG
jgi:hypothetical protein